MLSSILIFMLAMPAFLCDCPPDFVDVGGNCYYYSNVKANQADAAKSCR